MSSEERVKAEPRAGTFTGCLVPGDPETTAREKKIKRRAVGISVTLQTLGLTVLVIAPLLAKPAELKIRPLPPMPIYRSQPVHHVISDPAPHPISGPCFTCAIHSRPESRGVDNTTTTSETGEETINIGLPVGPDAGLNVFDSRKQPAKPDTPSAQPHVVHMTHIDPALLTHRIEPVFPALAQQLHRSGKVELHAIIGTDGGVQSLQVVSGDPLFINSAREAVLQWRYKPTYLNGEPVEIDTYITVIYILQ
jgi:periplasmic protein TonB